MNCVSLIMFLAIGALNQVLRFVDDGKIPMIIFVHWNDKIFLAEDIRLCPSTNLSITIL